MSIWFWIVVFGVGLVIWSEWQKQRARTALLLAADVFTERLKALLQEEFPQFSSSITTGSCAPALGKINEELTIATAKADILEAYAAFDKLTQAQQDVADGRAYRKVLLLMPGDLRDHVERGGLAASQKFKNCLEGAMVTYTARVVHTAG